MQLLRTIILSVVCGVLIWGGTSCVTASKPPVAPSAPSSFVPPVPDQWQLPNGLTVMLLEDRELPIVQGGLFIKGGSLWEPADQPGVIDCMGDQMRSGGAGELSADQLDLQLEKLAASVSSSFGAEYGKVNFYALSSDVDKVFSLFADVAFRPRFEQDRLTIWKGQMLEAIRRRKDDPHTIASLGSTQLLYDNTPYGTILVDADVERLRRDELLRAHSEMMRPQGAILILSGNITRVQAEALVQRYFSSWSAAPAVRTPPPAGPGAAPGIYFVKGPFEQATVIMGELGVPRLSPDYVAIEGFNEILSGTFGSRLFARIRTELGLAYVVYGAIQPGLVKGTNLITLQTKSASAATAISEVFRVMERLQREPPETAELADVQRSIENSFIFKFASTERIVERAALLKILEYPADYDQHHLDLIRALTPQDIWQVARTRWDLSKFVIVVVGDETAYTSLKALQGDSSAVLRSLPIKDVLFDQKLRL